MNVQFVPEKGCVDQEAIRVGVAGHVVGEQVPWPKESPQAVIRSMF